MANLFSILIIISAITFMIPMLITSTVYTLIITLLFNETKEGIYKSVRKSKPKHGTI